MEEKDHLGALLGSDTFCEKYASYKVKNLCTEIKKLSEFAKSQSQAVYAAFIHGELHKYIYFVRTKAHINTHLKTLDQIITK